ncbi:unnamed protein product [Penicillium pancosmium]
MPNTGKPSRDCHRCRQRRIKVQEPCCDLERLGCGQCQRKGLPCPGYREELDHRFRTETVSSFLSKRRKDLGKSKNQDLGSGSSGQIEKVSKNVLSNLVGNQPVQKHLEPQYSIAESWDDHLMPLVLNKLSCDDVNGNHKTIFKAIPHVISMTGKGSALYQVCDAIGRVYIANMTNSPTARSQQTYAYGKAIKAINRDIRDPQRCRSDEILVGVFLLSIYELLSSPGFSLAVKSPGWCIHTQGMIALLDQRQENAFITPENRSLFLTVFNAVQNQALITSQDYSWEFGSLIRHFYNQCERVELCVVRTAIFAHHCSRLCIVVQELIETGNHGSILSIYPSILHHMENLETETTPLSHDKCLRDLVIHSPQSVVMISDDIRDSGLHGYQSTFRLQVFSLVHTLLDFAYQAPTCTLQQQEHIIDAQKHCVKEFQTLADKVLVMLASMFQYDALPGSSTGSRSKCLPYRVGVWDIFRLWPLRFILLSPISSEREKEMATRLLEVVHLQAKLI